MSGSERKGGLRAGTVLAGAGLVMSFVLAWHLSDPSPFIVVAPVAIGGKWVENFAERWKPKPESES